MNVNPVYAGLVVALTGIGLLIFIISGQPFSLTLTFVIVTLGLGLGAAFIMSREQAQEAYAEGEDYDDEEEEEEEEITPAANDAMSLNQVPELDEEDQA